MPECSLCGKDVGSAESLSPVTSGETTVNDACDECRKAVAEDPVAEAKRLLAERTPGEWRLGADRILGKVLYAALAPPEIIVAEGRREDMELIAAAPRLLRALCERLEAAELRASKFGGLVVALRDVRGYAAAFRDAPNHIIERATDILDWASEAAE